MCNLISDVMITSTLAQVFVSPQDILIIIGIDKYVGFS